VRNAYKIFAEKPEARKPLRIPRRKWEDIKMKIKKVGWEGYRLDSSGSGEGPVAGSCGHGNEPSARNLLAS
jgi:hypothetical protein